jgi:hypothetical protein
MTWYKTGTVTVNNGDNFVTGTGTNFTANSRVGDGFRGPDGEWYEIVNISSSTVFGIYPTYAGVTVADSSQYMIAPLQGYNKESADRLRAITDSLTVVTSVAGRTGDVVLDKVDVGLPNVDNTADSVKPVSTAQQTALDEKIDKTSIVDDLTSTDATKVLSAKQGKTLSDTIQTNSTLVYTKTESDNLYYPKSSVYTKTEVNNILAAPVVPLASAATVDIGAAASGVVSISGTTTITSLGTVTAGTRRTVRFLGAMVLTYNSTSLILPTSANITTANNDTAEFLSLGGGNWFCVRYTLASGKTLAFTYDRSSILGTVSQSSGVPTGAVLETGTNAGGTYVRFADGTQICWKTNGFSGGTVANGSAFRSLSVDMGSYAIAFAGSIPVITASGLATSTGGGWAGQQTFHSLSGFGNWSVYTTTAATGSLEIRLMAIGRWY